MNFVRMGRLITKLACTMISIRCWNEIKQDGYDLRIRSFPNLLEVMKNKDHIDDNVFEHLWFSMYEDTEGHRVQRESNIHQESRQRTKNLIHEHQVELRSEWGNEIELELAYKKFLRIAELKRKVLDNEECEKRMRKLLQQNDIQKIIGTICLNDTEPRKHLT